MTDSSQAVRVFGADWCPVTRMTLRHLDGLGIPYDYTDVEEDSEASEWVKSKNNGMELKPTLDVQGDVLGAPSNEVLDDLLRAHGLLL